VRNRETGVIGGILTDMVQKRVDKVPLLGSLPWFLGGALFRSERTDTVKMELVLFLTPTLAEEL
jgi:general secretion pathway protein D